MDTSSEPQNMTKFEEKEEIPAEQFTEIWNRFPYQVRKSLNKTKRGELAPVSDEQLKLKIQNYLENSNE